MTRYYAANIEKTPGIRRHVLGRVSEAVEAARLAQDGRRRPKADSKTGVRYLGDGLYKLAFVSKDKRWVYKVSKEYAHECVEQECIDEGCRCDYRCGCPEVIDNWPIEDEQSASDDLRRQGYGWAAPMSTIYVDGIAVGVMRYYQRPPLGKVWSKAQAKVDDLENEGIVSDMHAHNWGVTPKGQLRCFDLGMG